LAKQDEISSTEKLLDQIRGENQPLQVTPSPSESSPSESKTGLAIPSLSGLTSIRRPITLGIDIGYTDLKLAKMDQVHGNKAELLDLIHIPFDPDIPRESPRFPEFLRSAVTEFCGSLRNIQPWCVASSAQVEIRYLNIPRVPKKQVANAVYWTFRKDLAIDEDKPDLRLFPIGGDHHRGCRQDRSRGLHSTKRRRPGTD